MYLSEFKTMVSNPYLLLPFANNPLLKSYQDNEFVKTCAIDIGFHGVKIATEEGLSYIPNVVCAKKSVGTITGEDPRRIVYRSDGHELFVGDLALHHSEDGDIRTSERYNLNFIKTPEFMALFRCAVYIATKGNPSPRIVTGLPSKAFQDEQTYLKELRRLLVGTNEFEIAVGNQVGSDIKYQCVSFTINKEHLSVYPQPIGTLASQSRTVENGVIKVTNDILLAQLDDRKRTIVDCGFYTVDVQTLVRGTDVPKMSFSLEGKGMFEPYTQIQGKILQLTRSDDFEGVKIPLWQLSTHLEKEDKSEPITIDTGIEDLDITNDCLEIYRKYANQISTIINDKDHLARTIGIHEIYLTGGPVEVLKDEFAKAFKSEKFKIASCNLNGFEVPSRFFNAVGYFYLLLMEMFKEEALGDKEVASSMSLPERDSKVKTEGQV